MLSFSTTLADFVLGQVQRFNTNPGDHCDLGQKNESFDLYDFARLVKQNVHDNAIQTAAQGILDAIADDPSSRYILYNSSNKAIVLPSLDKCKNTTWDLQNSHGVSIFFAEAYKRSFYNGDNLNFALGTDWTLTTPASIEMTPLLPQSTIEWGPLIVSYINAVHPDAVDDPSFPPMIAVHSSPAINLYLPLIQR
jgi:hypothetical protein